MSVAIRVGEGVVFTWLGMVLAISFLEAPLKFQVPGVTLQLGLRIGRVVFVALNACELMFAFVLSGVLYSHDTPPTLDLVAGIAVAALLVQLLLVRPVLNRRTKSVLELQGQEGPRSRGHHVYVALEVIKVASLLASGVILTGL